MFDSLRSRRGRLGALIVLVFLAPFTALTLHVVVRIGDYAEQRRAVDRIDEMLAISIVSGNLLHETQKERGLSSLFLSQGGDSHHQRLREQRVRTDGRHADLCALVAATPLDDAPEFGEVAR